MTAELGYTIIAFWWTISAVVLIRHYWRPTGKRDAGGFDAGSTSADDGGGGGSSWFSDWFDGGGGGGDCGGDSGGDCGGGGDSST